MFRRSRLLNQILILLHFVSLSLEIQYEFELEDDQVYTKCLDNPNGLKGIEGMLDLSDLTLELGAEGIVVSGNVTTVWDVEPTDRIEARISTLHWDRGFWQPTILNIYIFDFCKVMYDKNQLWYSMMTEHVINKDEVQDKCVKHKGTTLVYEQYLLKLYFGMGLVLPPGRHRIIINTVAIDLNNVTRPNGICFEIVGQFYKIYN
ncbi:hypothetical protein KR054_003527 [Drosophila jambulina]|nr:hypothetical protein KR054_003527 [Drosophila jambulina]